MKFAPGGGIAISADEKTNRVECWIKDNGMGFAPERIDLVFDNWNRSRPRRIRLGTGDL
jgi:signal transduction histidine kinase